jgi:hypothetical protein
MARGRFPSGRVADTSSAGPRPTGANADDPRSGKSWLTRYLASTGLILAGLLGATSVMTGVAGALTASHAAVSLVSTTVAPGCAALQPPPSLPTPSAPSSGTSITVAVTVEPVVGVELDPSGHPYAVRTNTGAAPSCADYFWIFTSPTDAVGHLGDLAQVNEVMALNSPTQAGPWMPGVWRSLPS